MADLFCNNCGHRNDDDANFCSSCGHGLHDASEEPATVTVRIDELLSDEPSDPVDVAGDAVLIATRGPNAGSRFALPSRLTSIGRHPDADIFLDDVTVSRRHVEIDHVDGEHVLRDVGSLNGTYLNRRRIDDPQVLRNSDEIQIGLFKLVFVNTSEG